jgi:methylenetetrahydrofolate dehydrogenase (NADP+)/methenyltetrahydrofolate cyclohydrolase
MCHSKSANLAEITAAADIVVCATGRARAFDAQYFKPGQVVLDVGTNTDAAGVFCGDVDFDAAASIVGAITPVPRGVGSVTTSVLVEHVVAAAERAL